MQLAGPALAAASRDTAIASSGEIIRDIEDHRGDDGTYPLSLQAVWHDYPAGVVGIAPYEYARAADAYQLAFKVPRMLLDDLGARELVVYHPGGDAGIVSHDSWILLLGPSELASSPGWFSREPLEQPGWVSFLFD
ncbi:hypothetical protein [Microbacterium sp.]|uniref:hypothetical protein n=1 Tax=Microbacterium sp. TaxID=51671 RepID=UPI003C716A6E